MLKHLVRRIHNWRFILPPMLPSQCFPSTKVPFCPTRHLWSFPVLGANSMGAMAPTAKKLWGDVPKSPHRNCVIETEKLVNFCIGVLSPLYTDKMKMYSKNYKCAIMQMRTGALISV